jgi:2-oxo-3-hexenedioate decarboxylase
MRGMSHADTILAALDGGRSIPLFSASDTQFDLPAAYRISREITARRVARGERVIGRKIGFTNRTIWDEYGVHHPIDGPMYDTTVRHISGPVSGVSLASFVEPKIEPEIVLGLSATPIPDMDEAALMGCIGWVAHGFEIVQSLYPGWRFKGADCVAAFGLHGALLCGPQQVIAPQDHAAWLEKLKTFKIRLIRDGGTVDVGEAANVLGGPVSALRHLIQGISQDAEAQPVKAGDVITTGTVTRAFEVIPGEHWMTEVSGIDLPGLDVTFGA